MTNDLISVEALQLALQQGNVVVMDCRFELGDAEAGRRAYQQGHIPTAVFADLNKDLSGPVAEEGGRHPLPDAADFEAFARAAGINSEPETLVVVYDASRSAFCARLWWMLRYFGHTNVKILDGGWPAWQAASLQQSTAEATATAGNFRARAGCLPVLHRQQLVARLQQAKPYLLDARDPDRFHGRTEPIDPRAGHIPGAHNYPWQQLTDEQGKLQSPEKLAQHFADAVEQQELVAYCGSGVTACLNIFALRQLGVEDVALYPGSWSDWSRHPDPV